MDDDLKKEYFDKATAAAQAATGRQYSAEELAAARARAQSMIGGGMDREGMNHMRNLSLATGMPAAKGTLEILVENGTAPEFRKKDLLARVKAATEPPEINNAVGCIEVKVPETETTVYLVLDRCLKDHDFSAQLDKIFSLIPVEKQLEIKQYLSMLLALGRSVFNTVVGRNSSLVKEILSHLPHGVANQVQGGLQVDSANTTLYLEESWTERVGLFVKSE